MLTYGNVVGRFVFTTVDGPDEDLEPDTIPLQGSITFAPSTNVLLATLSDSPTTVQLSPVTVQLDKAGAIKGRLISTDNEGVNPVNFSYNVSFNLTLGNRFIRYNSYNIQVPSNGTVDLTTAMPIEASGGFFTVQGPPGIRGPEGPAGSPGSQGPAGPAGSPGERGERGSDGTSLEVRGTRPTALDLPSEASDNDAYMTQDDGHLHVYDSVNGWVDAGQIRGPRGEAGERGLPGETGLQGEIGPAGPRGLEGAVGPQGLQGLQGLPGQDGKDAGVRVYLQQTAPANPEPNALWIW